MSPITKAVFPVAGPGSRLLSAASPGPREMMPVVDKPLIQYALEEALAAGLTDMVFITGGRHAAADHFDAADELDIALELRGKTDLIETVHKLLPKGVNCVFVRQAEPRGLGHAILRARALIGDGAFAVILADDLIEARPGALAQMLAQHERYRCSIVGVQRIGREEAAQHCVVRCHALFDSLSQVAGIAKYPRPADAPSTLGIVGRYILTPRIFDHLESAVPGPDGGVHLADAIAKLLREEQVLAFEFLGTRYDCASKLGYLKATLAYGLTHPEVGPGFAAFLEKRMAGPQICAE
ncbi:MAG TPA: UTP--glucose-1-phosphate uridylyltransferase [Burkholderiales bacterium]|nr:UTP--glucose-1-phosphate uridylyltransferase [Burkholderiales bacterium]